MISALRHIHQRRTELRESIDVKKHFEEWEETCVPSYCHPNLAASYVSWWRLFKSVQLAKSCLAETDSEIEILDFGSSVGELGHMVPDMNYHFIEEEEIAVEQLKSSQPEAVRHTLEELPSGFFDVIFALDSLEHNKNYEELLVKLSAGLKPGGIIVISGPTESFFYKLGRRLAGFDGHYHETNIYNIENSGSEFMKLVRVSSLPILTPLFRISVWRT